MCIDDKPQLKLVYMFGRYNPLNVNVCVKVFFPPIFAAFYSSLQFSATFPWLRGVQIQYICRTPLNIKLLMLTPKYTIHTVPVLTYKMAEHLIDAGWVDSFVSCEHSSFCPL